MYSHDVGIETKYEISRLCHGMLNENSLLNKISKISRKRKFSFTFGSTQFSLHFFYILILIRKEKPFNKSTSYDICFIKRTLVE